MNGKAWAQALLWIALVAGVPGVRAEAPMPASAAKEAEAADAQRAKALLARAVEHFKARGDAAFADFNDAQAFADGELYVYVLATDGVMLASGGSSSVLIGRQVKNMRDAFGNPFFWDMLEKAKAAPTGVVEYRWLNRLHHKVERKVTHFERVGKRILAVGYYIPRASPGQAAALLERAVRALGAEPEKAIAAFNDLNGGYVEDDLYVFVVGLDDGRFRAHGASPRLIGSDGYALADPEGKPIIRQMVEAVKEQERGEIDYTWRNPVTRKVESKHTLFRKVDNYLIGVGYYTR